MKRYSTVLIKSQAPRSSPPPSLPRRAQEPAVAAVGVSLPAAPTRPRTVRLWSGRAGRTVCSASSAPAALAEAWGRHRCRSSMTYEKMSRTLRYYYEKQLITKVTGRQHTYRFHYDKSFPSVNQLMAHLCPPTDSLLSGLTGIVLIIFYTQHTTSTEFFH
uniref:ETS domain-containing protein n=1 Tax=Macrostomum lignano TaxID=282301 RepID=A0A1I8JNA4_9PLAT